MKAEFPRDRKMQDLFFDEVSSAEQETVADEPNAGTPPAGESRGGSAG